MSNFSSFSQEEIVLKSLDTIDVKINPLAPAKAAFYSAILPGLGQAYNKKYWKIPVVYAALGTGIGIYVWNNKQYQEIRNEYKVRLLGLNGNVKFDRFSDSKLLTAQKSFQQQRDLSLLITVGLYVLNIIDANVDAHLLQFNVNGKLTVKPDLYQNPINRNQNIALSFNYNF